MPVRICCASALLMLFCCQVSQASDIYSLDESSMTFAVNVQTNLNGSYTLDNFKADWDDSLRVELDFKFNMPAAGRTEPFAGAYFFFEDKDWDGVDDTEGFNYEALGFGVQGGATVYPLSDFQTRNLNLGLMPYGRVGIGWQNAAFESIINEDDDVLSIEDIDGNRWELTVGADAKLILGRQFEIGTGVGWTYWNSSQVNAVYRDGTSAVVIRSSKIDFDGNETFVRINLGMRF